MPYLTCRSGGVDFFLSNYVQLINSAIRCVEPPGQSFLAVFYYFAALSCSLAHKPDTDADVVYLFKTGYKGMTVVMFIFESPTRTRSYPFIFLSHVVYFTGSVSFTLVITLISVAGRVQRPILLPHRDETVHCMPCRTDASRQTISHSLPCKPSAEKAHASSSAQEIEHPKDLKERKNLMPMGVHLLKPCFECTRVVNAVDILQVLHNEIFLKME